MTKEKQSKITKLPVSDDLKVKTAAFLRALPEFQLTSDERIGEVSADLAYMLFLNGVEMKMSADNNGTSISWRLNSTRRKLNSEIDPGNSL